MFVTRQLLQKQFMGATIPHLVLLGDSTLDNKTYVGRGNPSIIDQLKVKVKERGWNATSVAVDGHSISHIGHQLTKIPKDTTYLFISIGRMKRFLIEKNY